MSDIASLHEGHIYPPLIPPPFQLMHPDITSCTNVLLIDVSVADYQLFYDSVNSDTFPILYSSSSLRSALLSLLQQVSFQRLGIVFTSKMFLENQSFFDIENVDYMKSLNITHIDFFACETLNDTEWVNYYHSLSPIIIGASDDKTGNMIYGGDWVMESTSENIGSVYFTNSIEDYKYLLDNPYTTILQSLSPQYIIITGGYIYVTNFYTGSISKINVTNINDASLNWVTGLNYPQGIAISGNYIYSTNNGFISKININDPINDITRNWVGGFGQPSGIAISNNYLYVSNFNLNKVSRVNINNINDISLNWVTDLFGPTGITTDDTYLYVSNYYGDKISRIKLDLLDTNIDWFSGLRGPTGIVYDLGYLYVSNIITSAISKIKTDLLDTNINWITNGATNPIGLAISNNYLYAISDSINKISKIKTDLTDPTLGWIKGINQPSGIISIGDYIYVTNYLDSVSKIKTDLTDVIIDWVKGFSYAYGIIMIDNYIYVSNWFSGYISKFNINDINEKTIQWVDGFSQPQGMALNTGYLYITNYTANKISRVNVNNINDKTINWVTGVNGPAGIVSSGNYIYVANSNGHISKIKTDLTDSTLDWVVLTYTLNGIAIRGNYIYVTNSGGTITKINITDPINDRTYNWANGLNQPSSIAINGNYLYVTSAFNSIIRFELPLESNGTTGDTGTGDTGTGNTGTGNTVTGNTVTGNTGTVNSGMPGTSNYIGFNSDVVISSLAGLKIRNTVTDTTLSTLDKDGLIVPNVTSVNITDISGSVGTDTYSLISTPSGIKWRPPQVVLAGGGTYTTPTPIAITGNTNFYVFQKNVVNATSTIKYLIICDFTITEGGNGHLFATIGMQQGATSQINTTTRNLAHSGSAFISEHSIATPAYFASSSHTSGSVDSVSLSMTLVDTPNFVGTVSYGLWVRASRGDVVKYNMTVLQITP